MRRPRRWWAALLVGSIVLVLAGVLPALDAFVSYEADRGTGLEPAGFVPGPFPPDMPNRSGGDDPTQVVSGAVSVAVSRTPLGGAGGCQEVQRRAVVRVQEHLDVSPDTDTTDLTTTEGVPGVRIELTSPVTEAQVYVVCQDEVAVVATAWGPLGWPSQAREQVDSWFRGVRFR